MMTIEAQGGYVVVSIKDNNEPICPICMKDGLTIRLQFDDEDNYWYCDTCTTSYNQDRFKGNMRLNPREARTIAYNLLREAEAADEDRCRS